MSEERVTSSIEKAKKSFNEELCSEGYERLHADDEQLKGLLAFLAPENGQVFCDLGTGLGYVGMSLAQQVPGCSVIGLDIADRALQRNITTAGEKGLRNIRFQASDGVTLPFADGHLDGVICRYAFHHFPEYERTLNQISRVVRAGGRFVLSDALRNDLDTTDFINCFQALKPDGHVKMHKRHEFIALVERYGFELLDSFDTAISFTRDRTSEYDTLLDSTPSTVLQAYGVEKDEERIWITFEIMNLLFQKKPRGTGHGIRTDALASRSPMPTVRPHSTVRPGASR